MKVTAAGVTFMDGAPPSAASAGQAPPVNETLPERINVRYPAESALDVTPNLRAGSNEIIVAVYDPTDAGSGAVGKQRNSPGAIFYTATSGIWQTVWLEPVAPAHITSLEMATGVPGRAGDNADSGSGVSPARTWKRECACTDHNH